MRSYAPTEVREIIKAYTKVLGARTYFLERKNSDNIIEKMNGVERLEGALLGLKRLTSTELREMLPNINIQSLEESCKRTIGILKSYPNQQS